MAIKSLLLFLLLIVLACNNNDYDIPGCGLDNPREELSWLKSRIDSMAASTSQDMVYCYVLQGEYENSTVFRFEDCNPLIDKAVFTLNCDGNVIEAPDEIVFSRQGIKDLRIIWQPKNFACQIDF